jgi:DUF4097 and DUF4098 domain-containing protein YvlB
MNRRLLVAALAGLALFAASCGGTETTDFEFDEDVTSVVITSGSGAISLVGDDDDATVVDVTSSFSGEAPEVSAVVTDGVLTIDDGCGERDDCSVDLLITVPESVDIEVRSGDGDVDISTITGSLQIAAGDGNVRLNTVEGTMDVTTGDGYIFGTRMESPSGAYTTGSGDIDLAFDEIIADLTIEAGDGDVSIQLPEAPYDFQTDAGDGDVDLRLDSEAGAANVVRVTTGNGDIDVYRQ